MGPSGSGKTYSALRIATGIRKVTGGEIYYIDTEAGRSKHYAEEFQFRWVEFRPPFSPLDYLAALEHCRAKGASIIVVDSMSHEHEGPGGVLEMHEAEHQRMGGTEGTKMLAWSKPKQERRRLINSILQMQTNFIFCFRAKEKVKMVPVEKNGRVRNEPVSQGFMPIAGDEYVYEMTVNCLLYPGSGGVPKWDSQWIGEKAMTKLPGQFRALLDRPVPLSEETGMKLAEWASGASASDFQRISRQISNAENLVALSEIWPVLQAHRENKTLPPAEYKSLKEAYANRKDALERHEREQAEAFVDEPPPDALGGGEVFVRDRETGAVLVQPGEE